MYENNFRGVTSNFKIFKTDDVVIFNGVIDFHASDTNYQSADVLEINLPGQKLKRSFETVIYLKCDRGVDTKYKYNHNQYCTIVKSWIKDENTVCVEKFSGFDDIENLDLVFTSLYLLSNRRIAMTLFEKVNLRGSSEQYDSPPSVGVTVIQPEWVYIQLEMKQPNYEFEKTVWDITFEGLPEDLDIDIPIVGGNNPYSDIGLGYSQGHLSDKVLHVERRSFVYGSTGYAPFVLGYLIR